LVAYLIKDFCSVFAYYANPDSLSWTIAAGTRRPHEVPRRCNPKPLDESAPYFAPIRVNYPEICRYEATYKKVRALKFRAPMWMTNKLIGGDGGESNTLIYGGSIQEDFYPCVSSYRCLTPILTPVQGLGPLKCPRIKNGNRPWQVERSIYVGCHRWLYSMHAEPMANVSVSLSGSMTPGSLHT
jgi:hypothetical protein